MPDFNKEPEGVLIYSDPRWELRAYQATSKSLSVKVIQKSTWFFSSPPDELPKTIPEGVQDKLRQAFRDEAAHLLALHTQGKGVMPFVYHDESHEENVEEGPVACDCDVTVGGSHSVNCALNPF